MCFKYANYLDWKPDLCLLTRAVSCFHAIDYILVFFNLTPVGTTGDERQKTAVNWITAAHKTVNASFQLMASTVSLSLQYGVIPFTAVCSLLVLAHHFLLVFVRVCESACPLSPACPFTSASVLVFLFVLWCRSVLLSVFVAQSLVHYVHLVRGVISQPFSLRS